MKGKLIKTEKGWMVGTVQYADIWSTYIPLHPNDVNGVLGADVFNPPMEGKEVDFEIVNDSSYGTSGISIPYAKLVNTNKSYSPLPPITLKERIIGVLKYQSIELVSDDKNRYIVQCDWDTLADNLISCFEQFGTKK